MIASDPGSDSRRHHIRENLDVSRSRRSQMTQRPNCSRGNSFERSINSVSASLSSHMSSGSGGNFMTSMSLIFNIEFQLDQLQLMRDKLLSSNGDVYATFLAEKLKKSFGLRALPSLTESQPIITFEGDTNDDISFTLIYYNSQETSPLGYILKHYFGSNFMDLTNEVYNLLYQKTLNTSEPGSEISDDENRGIDDMEDEEREIGEGNEDTVATENYDQESNDCGPADEGFNLDDDLSTLQRESIDGTPHDSSIANLRIGSLKLATVGTAGIVTNPQIADLPLASSCSTGEKSNYSIKYSDTNKLVLNKKGVQSSSIFLNDGNSLHDRGLREHLLFSHKGPGKGVNTPTPSKFASITPNHKHVTSSPQIDLSPPPLMIDDETDPDWSPSSGQRRKPVARRTSDHLRTALMAFKSPTESDPNSTKRYFCNFKSCGKTFSVRSHLDSHKVTHTGEKRYVCNVCGGRFTQSSSLRNHRIAIHTKQYPHNCGICKKGFLLPSQLKKHKLSYHSSKKHMISSTSSHANALAAKILASAKTVQPVPNSWTNPLDDTQSE